jgi:poly-gamma-glutamate synthesis protein (capsule biosynthesis protein)
VSGVAAGAAAALAGGYLGVNAYLARSSPVPVATTAAPTPTPSPSSSGPTRVVIHGTGDVLLQGGSERWSGVADLFGSDDLTVVNLECVPSRLGTPVPKEFNFRCALDALAAMREAGVEVANQGNNHAGDYGPDALLDGRRNLIAAGLHPIGSGANTAEANAPALIERGGRKIAVLGFGGVVPSPGWLAGPSRAGQSDGYSIASMTSAVRAADAVADLVFVTIHWGAERDTEPRADDVARAHAMIDAGADGIFGHHAHVLQKLDWYKGRPIAYGLGNFVWPRGGPTAIAEFIVEPSGEIKACLLPAYITGGRPVPSKTSCD